MGPFWSKFSELHVLRKRGCGTKGFGASIWKYLDDYAHESINLSWWHVHFFAVTWVFWLKVKPKTLNFKVVQRRNSYRNTLKYHKKISIFWVVNIHKTCIKHPQFPAILVWKTSEFPPRTWAGQPAASRAKRRTSDVSKATRSWRWWTWNRRRLPGAEEWKTCLKWHCCAIRVSVVVGEVKICDPKISHLFQATLSNLGCFKNRRKHHGTYVDWELSWAEVRTDLTIAHLTVNLLNYSSNQIGQFSGIWLVSQDVSLADSYLQ